MREHEKNIIKKNYSKCGPFMVASMLKTPVNEVYVYANDNFIEYNHRVYNEKVLSSKIKDYGSIRELCIDLGITITGASYKIIKNYMNLYNLDISHFNNGITRKRLKIPTEEILVSGSTYGTSTLKKRLYKEGIKERICELCGQNDEWMGKKMSLILDHINGINTDNRIENLRIVCPNCDTTLDTFSGKNNKRLKKENFCSCGCKINNKSLRCVGCSEVSKRKVVRPTYNQLLEEIETLGYVGTGKKYGVSDNSIRKWKKHYEYKGV